MPLPIFIKMICKQYPSNIWTAWMGRCCTTVVARQIRSNVWQYPRNMASHGMARYGTTWYGTAGDQMPRLTACPAFFTQWKAAGGI